MRHGEQKKNWGGGGNGKYLEEQFLHRSKTIQIVKTTLTTINALYTFKSSKLPNFHLPI